MAPMMTRSIGIGLALAGVFLLAGSAIAAEPGLTISWEKNYLTIRGDFPGQELKILYL
jgi:hypothetical protein